jgi:short-subunit dehydrogenase
MKKILIVGASSGIGKELAIAYAKSGNIVGITGRRAGLLKQISDAFPEYIRYAEHDIAGNNNTKIMTDLIKDMGGLDILIISAGTGFENNMLEWELEKKTIDVNVLGFAEIVNIGYAFFKKQKSGHIAGISSVAALRGIGGCPAYSASKAFISNYLEAVRNNAKKNKLNIWVTDIRPGFVDTQMAKGGNLFWLAPVEKAARQIMKAIENRVPVAYVTKRWRLVALALRFMPRVLYEKL